MISELDTYYLSHEEPIRSCLVALRKYTLALNGEMTETWTHRMPMFRYKGKLFSYLWVDKNTHLPYVGIYRGLEVDHPKLDLGNRNKMKIMTIDPEADLPVTDLDDIFNQALRLYK